MSGEWEGFYSLVITDFGLQKTNIEAIECYLAKHFGNNPKFHSYFEARSCGLYNALLCKKTIPEELLREVLLNKDQNANKLSNSGYSIFDNKIEKIIPVHTEIENEEMLSKIFTELDVIKLTEGLEDSEVDSFMDVSSILAQDLKNEDRLKEISNVAGKFSKSLSHSVFSALMKEVHDFSNPEELPRNNNNL